MAVYSIIQKFKLEGSNRLDAEYYQPEYLKIRENIKNIGFFNFGDIIVSFCSGKNLKQTEENNSIKFIRTQNVRPIIIDSDGMSFTQEKIYPELNYGDLLFVRVGEGVGNSSVVTKSFENSTFSDNVIRIKIQNVNPFYVSVLLNSKIGDLLMEQIKKGSARSLISRENLNSLQIPKINYEQQIYFEKAINQSEKLMLESEKIYSQAEDLLLEELGLKNYKSISELWSVIDLSETQKMNRIDAEYFQPKYQIIIKKIKNNSRYLGELATLKKGFEPGSEEYQEKGKLFIRVSSISKDGITDKDQKYLKDDLYNKLKKDYEPKVGEILLTKDASPGIAYAVKEPIEGIVAGGVLRLKVKENIETEYIALVINSLVGQSQVERDAGGSVIAHWKPDQVKQLLVPILPKSTQQKIAELVRQSHEARKKAKELLEEAKRKVEEMIDKR